MAKNSYIRGQQRAKLARRRQLFAWHSRNGVPSHGDALECESQEEFWQLQEDEQANDFKIMKLYLSKTNGIWRTKRFYKKKYSRQRRRQARDLCYYAIHEDAESFDRISPDDFMGRIWWDLW